MPYSSKELIVSKNCRMGVYLLAAAIVPKYSEGVSFEKNAVNRNWTVFVVEMFGENLLE